jgi:hypothetical protein
MQLKSYNKRSCNIEFLNSYSDDNPVLSPQDDKCIGMGHNLLVSHSFRRLNAYSITLPVKCSLIQTYLERGPLSLVSTIEELLRRKISGSGLEIRDYGRKGSALTTRLRPRSLFACFLFVLLANDRYSVRSIWMVFFLM